MDWCAATFDAPALKEMAAATATVAGGNPLERAIPIYKIVADRYPVGADDPLENRATVNVAWLTAPAADAEECPFPEVEPRGVWSRSHPST